MPSKIGVTAPISLPLRICLCLALGITGCHDRGHQATANDTKVLLEMRSVGERLAEYAQQHGGSLPDSLEAAGISTKFNFAYLGRDGHFRGSSRAPILYFASRGNYQYTGGVQVLWSDGTTDVLAVGDIIDQYFRGMKRD